MDQCKVWVVNDHLTTIPGTRTLWHDLCEWIGGEFIGGDYPLLAGNVEQRAMASGYPDVIIRNGTWFGSIEVPAPTICLIQDIMPEHSWQRMEQVRVCRAAALTVFNSAYTKSKYPELADITSRVIPLSVDSDIFRPMEVEPVADVCWIGAPTYIKGWDILGEVIKSSARTFAIVLKEKSAGRTPDNVRIFDRVPHTELPKIINGCSVGLCTSREESQHLAGIEMGMCGLPMVAPRIGCYLGLGHPGIVHDSAPASSVSKMLETLFSEIGKRGGSDTVGIAAFWRERFSRDVCRDAWKEAVEWARSS
jgi:glycosyltransferase involved in cell wall biosynthesis